MLNTQHHKQNTAKQNFIYKHRTIWIASYLLGMPDFVFSVSTSSPTKNSAICSLKIDKQVISNIMHETVSVDR